MNSTIQSYLSSSHLRFYGLGTMCAVLGFGFAKYINDWASQRALNHYVSDPTWDWDKELVVITGGSSGIGLEIVKGLSAARKGVKIVVLDVNSPREELPFINTASNVHYLPCDLASPPSIATACSTIRSSYGDPTVLINNAGVGAGLTLLSEPMSQIRDLFEVNFFSHVELLKEFLPSMVKNNHGHIVATSSMGAVMTRGANIDYSASKCAVAALNDGLGVELGVYFNAPKVRTSVVFPAWVNTPLCEHLVQTGKFHEPMVEASEVAGAVVTQLLSGNSGHIYVPSWLSLVTSFKGWPHWLQERMRFGQTLRVKEARDESLRRKKK